MWGAVYGGLLCGSLISLINSLIDYQFDDLGICINSMHYLLIVRVCERNEEAPYERPIVYT